MSGIATKPGRSRLLLAAGVLAAFLAACSTPSAESDVSARPPVNNLVPGESYAPSYIAVVELDGSTDVTALAAELNGTALLDTSQGVLSNASAGTVRQPASVAFIGLDEAPSVTSLSALSASGANVTVEVNQDRFLTSANRDELGSTTMGDSLWPSGNSRVWADGNSRVWADGNSRVWADGNSRVWADGNSRVWADGNSRVWADGQFQWLPENTDTWKQVNLRDGHEEARRLGHNIVVAVIDTGVDVSHPALQGALAPNGYDFVDNDSDPSEVGTEADPAYGHGTVVAGIVDRKSTRATILPVRALEADGTGDVLNVVRAVYYAVEQGADVINLSLGSQDESPALTDAVAYADSHGVFVTTTAGNLDLNQLNYPAAIANRYQHVISVTSVDSRGNKSSFSNYGRQAEIAAPGERIYGPYPELSMAAWSGTSMAAPVVAGAVALALGEPKLDVRRHQIAEAMFDEADDDIYDNRNNRPYRSGSQLGAGLIDIEEFIDEVVD